MDLMLGGKVVLLVGAGGGIAAALTKELKQEGAFVALCLPETGGEACGEDEFFRCDLADEAEAEWLRAALMKRFGRLDAVVFGQTGAEKAGLFELDAGGFQNRMVPARAAFLCCKVFGQCIGDQGRGGAILFLTSIHDEKPSGSDFAHSLVQGMISNLVMEAALQYGELGVRVNQISAGAMEGDQERFPSDLTTLYEGCQYKVPAGRLGKAQDIAPLAAFLLSDRASFVNGVRVRADGGFLLHYIDHKANLRAIKAAGEVASHG